MNYRVSESRRRSGKAPGDRSACRSRFSTSQPISLVGTCGVQSMSPEAACARAWAFPDSASTSWKVACRVSPSPCAIAPKLPAITFAGLVYGQELRVTAELTVLRSELATARTETAHTAATARHFSSKVNPSRPCGAAELLGVPRRHAAKTPAASSAAARIQAGVLRPKPLKGVGTPDCVTPAEWG